MAFGKRIRLFRTRKGLLQKQLGELLGFHGKTSDVRIAQYENESRTPKDDLVKQMADILDVSPSAISVPDIDTYIGLMHTLFALEDMYGLKVNETAGNFSLSPDPSHKEFSAMSETLSAWAGWSKKLQDGEISKEEYDNWRYNYPKDTPGYVSMKP